MSKQEYAEGLRILARQNALTEDDWFNLIGGRRALLEPYLRNITLKALGDLKIIYDDETGSGAGYGRMLRDGGLAVVQGKHGEFLDTCAPTMNSDFPLDTRGIFPDDDVYYGEHFKYNFREKGETEAVGEIKFWGLTRNNEWIVVEVKIKKYSTQSRIPDDHSDPLGQRAEVEKVWVRKSNPREICAICKITPKWMWLRLGTVGKEWALHRQRLLLKAEQLAEVIKCEEMILGVIK